MVKNLLVFLDQKEKADDIGCKAANIQHLQRLGMRTPLTYLLRWEAHTRYKCSDLSVIDAISKEIDEKLDPQTQYAVRSSANLEDSFENSFAGQFKTALNVQGRSALIQAIWSVWASADTPAVQEYLSKRNGHDSSIHMAVIIQKMVQPQAAGVVFSRNPMNGLRETVIEAVCGPGTLLVQEGVTPLRWVYRGGSFTSQPEDGGVPQQVIEEVVAETRRITRRLKRDIDMEWAYDGQQLYWLQMRDITALSEVKVYSNVISREMMAGMIKPLIWSVNIPLVNTAWVRLITELIGPNQLKPHEMAKSFYYRSYFNMGLMGQIFEDLGFPAESLEMAGGIAPKGTAKFKYRPGPKMLRLLPRLARFVWDKWRMSRRLERRLEAIEASYRAIDFKAAASLKPEELLDQIDQLFATTQEAAYFNIILPLLMYGYNGVLRSQFKKIGVDYALVDMHQDTPEFQHFSPNAHLAELNRIFKALPPSLQAQICRSQYDDVMRLEGINDFQKGLDDLMLKFGHLSDNGNDFSATPWRENGDMILQLVVEGRTRAGKPSEGPVVDKIRLESIRLPWWKGWMIRRLHRRTRRYNLYREHISYIYTYGYGLFRGYFLALGNHLAQTGLLKEPSDIFYLDWEQIRGAVREGAETGALRAIVAGHQREMEQLRKVQLPSIIYGDVCPPIEIASSRKLVGTPTSRGYCTGRVKVVTGLQDFPKVQPNDILVIPFSDVGWTPLFAQVVGVIAESGGMLSHSSIIAREYGIPAVVSVPGATLLEDGTLVHMDGYKGEIVIDPSEEEALTAQPPEKAQMINATGAQIANP